jgi:hypothetical protein
VTTSKRLVCLIIVAVLVFVLAIIVLIHSRGLTDHLLAVIGLLGGVAVVVVSLPSRNGG